MHVWKLDVYQLYPCCINLKLNVSDVLILVAVSPSPKEKEQTRDYRIFLSMRE